MNPAHKNFVLLVGCCLALTIPQSQTLGGNASKRQGYIPVLKIDEGYVDAQGVFIYYKSLGSGPPLLILHGGPGASHDYLLPHLAPLARKNRLVFIDERGGGKSPKLENPAEYTVGNMVEDTEAVRKALRLGKINLLGHSCGGVLAQAYALKYQKNLSLLLLCSTFYSTKRFNEVFSAMKAKMSPDLRERIERMEAAGLVRSRKGLREESVHHRIHAGGMGRGLLPVSLPESS